MTGTVAVFTILSSAIIVLTGIVALTRAVWKAALDLRDNRLATNENTQALKSLEVSMDGRLTSLESRMGNVEHQLAGRML